MRIKIEYNDVLALREYSDDLPLLRKVECIPIDLVAQKEFSYLKRGYRILPINKIIPLVLTKGNQQFISVPALISIQSIVIDLDPFEGNIYTSGAYWIVKLLNKDESHMWLKILQHPHELDIFQ